MARALGSAAWARTMARRATVSNIMGGIVVTVVVNRVGMLALVVMTVRRMPVAIEMMVLLTSSV